jgi:poly(3-hydroxybutyrate) depolymerase
MMSGTTSQVFNMMGIDNTQSVYLIKPKNYDKNKEYPVVFFMHGFLGNWKLYTGVLKGLEDCIVLCVGTHTWSGIYTKNDINALFKKQIPFLENMGYKVDKKNLHIMGLSNGGSAVNVAYNGFSNKFKTITFISTGIHQTYPITSKVLLIGGGKDHSAGTLQGAYRTLKNNGGKTDLFWDDEETHFILVNQTDEIINFVKKNLQ